MRIERSELTSPDSRPLSLLVTAADAVAPL